MDRDFVFNDYLMKAVTQGGINDFSNIFSRQLLLLIYSFKFRSGSVTTCLNTCTPDRLLYRDH